MQLPLQVDEKRIDQRTIQQLIAFLSDIQQPYHLEMSSDEMAHLFSTSWKKTNFEEINQIHFDEKTQPPFLFTRSAQLGSNQFLAPYEMTIESELAFAPAQEEIDQMRLSFEAQQWPVEVLKYTLFRLQQNPYIVSGFSIELTLQHPDQSKKIGTCCTG